MANRCGRFSGRPSLASLPGFGDLPVAGTRSGIFARDNPPAQLDFGLALSPVGCENVRTDQDTLSGRAGGHLPQVLVGYDALFDSKHDIRRVAFYFLQDAAYKVVEEVDSGVVANHRTNIV